MAGTPTVGVEPKRLATTVDAHVGSRIRELRRQHGMSQQHLAGELGLTFQQVQKYERGTNRVSASKLYETANVLRVPVSYFFEGLEDPPIEADMGEGAVHAFLTTEEGAELARTFPRIAPGRLRQRVLELVRGIVETHETQGHGGPAPAGAPNK